MRVNGILKLFSLCDVCSDDCRSISKSKAIRNGFLTSDGCEMNTTNNYENLWVCSVRNFIPFSQFLRLRHLCSEDSKFSLKKEEVCFFDKRGYPASVIQAPSQHYS